MRSRFRRLRHGQKCKKMKLFQDMQLIQKLRDDQKCMKKVVEDMSGSNDIKEMDKNKDKTGQNRARDRKEREKTSPTVPSDFIGPA
ncbi:hypothetical protein Tco_0711938, partial [Tanacetum coccineum]